MSTNEPSVKTETYRIGHRYAGHCYSTTYRYSVIERKTSEPRKDGKPRKNQWEVVRRFGRRTSPGFLHSGCAHLPEAREIATHVCDNPPDGLAYYQEFQA